MKTAPLMIAAALSLSLSACGSSSGDSANAPETPAASAPTTTTSAAVTNTDKQACEVYGAMKFDDKHDKATAYAVWKIRDGLTGDIATFADTHHKAWAETDYNASMQLLTLWPTVQKQCATLGVKVQDWQVVSYN